MPTGHSAAAAALVPVFMSPAGGYPLYRMVVERVVSAAAMAAGGNATPMTLGV
ncbi:hypothetical protein [uncultured Dechloromonas sp.]|uniref:hypothetical protein n=1 Tax=uncultured Dechloromonas sp. TaxID=171719 RepID=UPI0025DF76A6|nr:hypothetical protein [uncultured Dechloromonas sp.]